MKRTERAQIARETVDISLRGGYVAPDGTPVSIASDVAAAIDQTRLYRPGELPHLKSLAQNKLQTTFEVTGETTLAAARRLVGSNQYAHVGALNFASARHPGGGFLNGSLAQEESLASASALYVSISKQVDYYSENNKTEGGFYTDHTIFSPRVPVFRDDESNLLSKPYLLSFITAPAVNAGVVKERDAEQASRIGEVMRNRIAIVLNAALDQHVDCLILGAWGCGVFRNDPAEIAGLFAESLLNDAVFTGAFRHVCFAVLDRSPDQSVIGPFVASFL